MVQLHLVIVITAFLFQIRFYRRALSDADVSRLFSLPLTNP
jgi:hypothetical protein